jgi:hypothetical protein
MLGPTFRWRCASSYCHCGLHKVGLIPKASRALPPEPFAALHKMLEMKIKKKTNQL